MEKQIAEITIIKTKKDKATVIEFGGEKYALVHKDYINGNKNKAKGKK